MFSKIFANFSVCVLTHSALQHLLFFLLFLIHFLGELTKLILHLFSMLLVDFWESKIGIVSSGTPENSHLSKMRAASSNIKKHSNTHVRAHLHETRSELEPVWNLKPIWKVVLFTCQFQHDQPWDWSPFQKLFRLHSDFTAATFQSIVRF